MIICIKDLIRLSLEKRLTWSRYISFLLNGGKINKNNQILKIVINTAKVNLGLYKLSTAVPATYMTFIY